jgi:organic hydroperoxide reductase OsmC/OhrA
MNKEHFYQIKTEWTGKEAAGNKNIRTYSRSHTISNNGKPDLHLTTDNAAVGDQSKLNPEDLLVSAISSCHMLSYLYVCSLEGIVITAYTDNAKGVMIENANGGGSFKEVVLNPICTVAEESMIDRAIELHHKAHEICYIANSVNFEVKCNPTCSI